MIAIYELSCNLELVELVHGDPEPNTIMCLSRQQQIISPSLIFFFYSYTKLPCYIWGFSRSRKYFWFSGTGIYEGSGPNLLMNKRIVLVSINYRLGPLGFLSLGTKEVSLIFLLTKIDKLHVASLCSYSLFCYFSVFFAV